MISARGSGGFFMRMRTGKTLACIDAIGILRSHPVLVICPASVIASWESALLGDGWPQESIRAVRSTAKKTPHQLRNLLILPGTSWAIVSFEMVRRLDVLMVRRRLPEGCGIPDWAAVVVDESYRVANDEARVVEYLLRRPKPANQARFCLSGAPASEHPLNFATQYIFMDGHYFGCTTVDEYREKYWVWNKWRFKWLPQDPAHLDAILNYVHGSAFCITLEDLGMGGMRLYDRIRVEPNEAQIKLLKWVSITTTYPDKKTGKTKIMDPLVRVTFEHKISTGVDPLSGNMISTGKVDAAVEYWIRRNRVPMLIISRFVAPVAMAATAFTAAGARVGSITGATSPAERERIRSQFQAGELDVVVSQVIPVKMGLDFSALDSVIYLSNSFSQDDRSQSEERGQHLHRTTPYNIVDIETTGTHDSVLTEVLTIKRENANLYVKAWNFDLLNTFRNGE